MDKRITEALKKHTEIPQHYDIRVMRAMQEYSDVVNKELLDTIAELEAELQMANNKAKLNYEDCSILEKQIAILEKLNPDCICHRTEKRYCPMHSDGPDC